VQVSIIIPAFQARATIARAVQSALAQSWSDIEVIIVSDDGFDYDALLQTSGIADNRLRFVSTGRIGSGCHNARNVGLTAAGGHFIAALDADDVFHVARIASLLPITQAEGAAVDNPRVVNDRTNKELYRAFNDSKRRRLDVASLLSLSMPLFPLIARQHAQPRLAGIELAEDVVANLRLIDRLGSLSAGGETLSDYRVVAGSLSHNDRSADGFEKSYTELIERLENGDRLGLSIKGARQAAEGLIAKREFNRAFALAKSLVPDLDFQSFAARRR